MLLPARLTDTQLSILLDRSACLRADARGEITCLSGCGVRRVLSPLAAGCGRSSGSHVAQLSTSTTQDSPPSGGSAHDHALAYARCMHVHGVPLWPDPGSSGSSNQAPLTLRQLGVSSSQLTAAQQACRSLVPTSSAALPSP